MLNRRTVLTLTASLAALTMTAGVASAADTTIAGIVFQQDQFFRTIQLGMESAAKAAGKSCSRPIPNRSPRRRST